MFRPRIIPILLLRNKGLVKTIKFSKARYIGDPINAVKIFNDMEADELIFLDIDASVENRGISDDLVKQIGDEAFMPFSVGGGINSIQQISKLITAGAEKVVLNTASILNPYLVKKASDLYGSQSIIISIDVKKNYKGRYIVFTHSGKNATQISPVDHAHKMAQLGAGEILINSIDRDGTYEGYDIDLIKMISDSIDIPVIACGGAGKIEDFVIAINEGHSSAVAAGSLFVYHGPRKAVLINYPEKQVLINLFNS